MKSFSGKFIALIAAITLSMPFAAFTKAATETGTITINVVNQDGDDFNGQWFLHKGNTDQAQVVRNGLGSESFTAETGVYYLKSYNVDDTSSNVITTQNPQTLTAEQKVTFTIEYTEAEGYTYPNDPNSQYSYEEQRIAELAKQRSSTDPANNKTIAQKLQNLDDTDASSGSSKTSSTTITSSAATTTNTSTNAGTESNNQQPFRLASTGVPLAAPLLLASVAGFFALPNRKR